VPLDKPENSLLQRLSIADPFLRTYFKNIAPRLTRIRHGSYNKAPESAVSYSELSAHLGYAFETLCVTKSAVIASTLGFSAVDYRAGSYFSRVASREIKNYQLDLIFQRADQVHTISEIKYSLMPVDASVIAPFERAISLYSRRVKQRVERVLITAAGATESLKRKGYFDRVLTLAELAEEL
jgi:hypothetical protein